MNNWNYLPNELLLQIVSKLENDYSKNKWMFVNKKWYDLYQSILYKNISIRLDLSDTKLDNIIHSAFEPGRWVKSVEFASVVTHADLDNFMGGLLNLLMVHSPNVERVEFKSSVKMSAKDWAYFTIVLTHNGSWKLHYLPKTWHSKLTYSSYYYNCAYHLRESLVRLDLTHGMIGRNFSYLGDFTKLTTLDVDKNVLENMNTFDSMLQYLPHLKNVLVKFPSDKYSAEVQYSLHHNSFLPNTYSNIREMTLVNYTPSTDQELLAFMKKFAGLNKLSILGNNNKPWPVKSISRSVIESFFKFVHAISTYRITVEGTIQNTRSIYDEYYSISNQSSAIEGNKLRFSIMFKKRNNTGTSADADSSISFRKCGSEAYTEMGYFIIDDLGLYQSAARRVLAHIKENIRQTEELSLDEVVNGDTVGICLSTLIGSNHRSLRKITISRAHVDSYTPFNESEQHQDLDCLTFKYNKMHENFLPSLSKSLKKVENLHFIGSWIQKDGGQANQITISMPDTAIDTIYLSDREIYGLTPSFDRKKQSIILISVTSANRNKSTYYMCADDDTAKFEIARYTFDLLKKKLSNRDVTVIYVNVKSIRQFSLYQQYGTQHDIKIYFP